MKGFFIYLHTSLQVEFGFKGSGFSGGRSLGALQRFHKGFKGSLRGCEEFYAVFRMHL